MLVESMARRASHTPPVTNLPLTTPIEPVSVEGCATMTCAGTQMAPARRRQIGHRRDERPIGALVARDHQLAPDGIGGGRGPARAVDAKHDGTHRTVAARLPDGFRSACRSRHRAVDRIVAALPAADRADA